MNFNGNFVLWCVLLLTKQCVLTEAGECVQRRLGACKVLQLNPHGIIDLKDFSSPQPEGFLLKTSIEINLAENKHNFENNLPVEKKRPIGYNLDNAALVRINIRMDAGDDDVDDDEYIFINLGKKYYGLAELEYFKFKLHKIIETKYSRYTPILPTFPYNLHLEMTTNGTFSVYADANTEPFFQYQVDNRLIVETIIIASPDQTDLIAFVDCSEKHKPNCGSHRVDRLDGCREWKVERWGVGSIMDLEGFQKTYEKDVLFDEFVVVDNSAYSSDMRFYFSDDLELRIEFKNSSIKAEFIGDDDDDDKSVVTTKWPRIPANPYAVRIQLTNGTHNNRLTISSIRGDEILTLNLCGVTGSLDEIRIYDSRLYFDCLNPDDKRSKMMNERPRKTNEKDNLGKLTYHENGYNFSKTFLDTRHYESEPFVLYTHTFGKSTKDWCDGEVKPELFVLSKGNDDPLQSVIKSSNKALLSELEKISNATADTNKALLSELENVNAQLNATADTNKAIADTNKALLSELETISNASADTKKAIVETKKAVADTNKAVLSELQSVKASIDALATHLERNTTTVNNYYNQLNVTEFLKLIKQN